MMPNGLFRATHPHNPTRYSHIMVLTPHFYAHIGAGLKGHSTTSVQAHVGLDLLPLTSFIIINSYRKKRKASNCNGEYFPGKCIPGWCGDEFVIIETGIVKAQFFQKLDELRREMEKRKENFSIGVLWRENENDIVTMLKEAR